MKMIFLIWYIISEYSKEQLSTKIQHFSILCKLIIIIIIHLFPTLRICSVYTYYIANAEHFYTMLIYIIYI